MPLIWRTTRIFNYKRLYKVAIADEFIFDYDEESVKAIIEWAQTTQLPKEVTLSESEHIIDTSMYVHANICDINQHYPDPFYNPAIDRLYRLKEYMEDNM